MKPEPPEPQEFQVSGMGRLPSDWSEAALLVNKPAGWTSFDVVRRLRRLLHVKKIGHAGTLDPMATGLLICMVGKATKKMELFMGMSKLYTGTLRLGETTPSYDADSEVETNKPWQHLTPEDLDHVRATFVGLISQTPPMFSAVKVEGERLYKKARRGEHIARSSRHVEITRFVITGWVGPDVSFEVACTKGTYIRALAHDFGERLGVGAHLIALCRVAIGSYRVEQAWSLEALENALSTRSNQQEPVQEPSVPASGPKG